MRTWTVERPGGERESEADAFIGYRNDGEAAFHRVALVSPFHPSESFSRFIVDACNAAEQKAHWLRAWYGVPDADMQNHEIWPKSAPLSPRGHAVMEDLAHYEAMHPVHNSPEVRLTE